MLHKYYEDKRIYCFNCKRKTVFTHRDLNHNIGVERHCSECSGVWFEWQNRAVEREMEKWIEFNSRKFSKRPFNVLPIRVNGVKEELQFDNYLEY